MTTNPDGVLSEVHPDGGVVVGDDGSEPADLALTFALEEARRRACTLHVVRAWSMLSTSRPVDVPPGVAATLEEYQVEATRLARDRVDDLFGSDPGVPVEVYAVHSPAAQALITAAETADVLVVGSRGRGGFRALALGSVADQCVRHAGGVVVVVRPHHP